MYVDSIFRDATSTGFRESNGVEVIQQDFESCQEQISLLLHELPGQPLVVFAPYGNS